MRTIYVVSRHHKRYENGVCVSHDQVMRQITLNYADDGMSVIVSILPTLSSKRAVLVNATSDTLFYETEDGIFEFQAHLRPDNTIDVFTLKRLDRGITIEYYEL